MPVGPVKIDWSHPLTNGLLFYGYDTGSMVIDLVGGTTGTIVGTADTGGMTPNGPGIAYNGSTIYLPGSTRADIDAAQTSQSFSWACAYYQTGTVGAYTRPFGRTANNAGLQPYANWDFEINPGGAGQNVVVSNYAATTIQSSPQWTGNASNVFTSLLSTVQVISLVNAVTLYAQGQQAAQNLSANVATATNANANIMFSGGSDAGIISNFTGKVYYGAFWNRVLRPDEAALLHADPYCFLVPAEGEMPALQAAAPVQASGTGGGPPKKSYVLQSYPQGLRLPGIQPRGPSRIDWSNPILNGISYLKVFNNSDDLNPDFVDNGKITLTRRSSLVRTISGGTALTTGMVEDIASASTYNIPTTGTLVCYQTAAFAPNDGVNHSVATFGTDPHALYLYKNGGGNWHGGWNDIMSVSATGTFSAGDTFSLGFTWSAAGQAIYVRGKSVVSTGTAPTPPISTLPIAIGGLGAGTWPWDTNGTGGIYYIAVWSRVLSTDELAALDADPYAFLVPAEGEMPALLAPTGGAVTGTLATTEAKDVAAFTGTAGVAGTLATTEAQDVAAFNATFAITGTLAPPRRRTSPPSMQHSLSPARSPPPRRRTSPHLMPRSQLPAH